MGKVLIFAPPAAPEVEAYLCTVEGTDEFCRFFVSHGILTEEEFVEFTWEMKKDFIRMYLLDLRKRKNETIRRFVGDVGEKSVGGFAVARNPVESTLPRGPGSVLGPGEDDKGGC